MAQKREKRGMGTHNAAGGTVLQSRLLQLPGGIHSLHHPTQSKVGFPIAPILFLHVFAVVCDDMFPPRSLRTETAVAMFTTVCP